MTRKIALPLLIFTFAVCSFYASGVQQPNTGGTGQREAEIPTTSPEKKAVSPYENLTITVAGEQWSARLQTGTAQPSGDGHSSVPYMLFGPNDVLLEEDSVNCDETTAELCSVALREADDVLGYPGFCFEQQTWGGRITRYYAVTEGGAVPAGMSHSLPGSDADDHSVDFDGDGRSELVCNVQFNADGVQKVYIYRWNGQDTDFPVQAGSISWEKAIPEAASAASRGGAINRGELYHAADNTVELIWRDETTGSAETARLRRRSSNGRAGKQQRTGYGAERCGRINS